jgi:hypothetical protein
MCERKEDEMSGQRICCVCLIELAVITACASAAVTPITKVVVDRETTSPPKFWLKSIAVGGYTIAVDELVTGTSEGKSTAQPAPYNDIKNADNFDLNLFAGRASETPPTWQIQKLGGQPAWVDTNGDDPDFFLFEAGGNQDFSIEAILPGGIIGASVQVPQAIFGDTGLVITNSGPQVGQIIAGVAFAITDLLDDKGEPLTNSSIIEGIQITSPGIDPSCFCAVAAPPMLKAMAPKPADGTVGLIIPLFQWAAGSTAALHEVYFGTSPELTAQDLVAPRQPLTMYYHPSLKPGTTYYWRVDEVEADMTTVHRGDVWSFTTQAVTAYYPTPVDGAVDAAPAPVLTWLAGQAAVKHHVYFSGVHADVNTATAAADKGIQSETSFAPGTLESLTTYYWRVDEVLLGDVVKTGAVWSFTTYLPVDDFEGYNDDLKSGAVFLTWADGAENGTGSVAGYFQAANGTFNETTIVNGGGQSMPVDYNNVKAPFYSEVQRTWAPVQNWTAQGIVTLVLHVRGERANAAAPLYVALADSAGRSAVIVHPDPEIVRKTRWTRWQIPLSAFGDGGVNVSAVKTMYLGVGDRKAPTAGGAGRIYVDDIYLTK